MKLQHFTPLNLKSDKTLTLVKVANLYHGVVFNSDNDLAYLSKQGWESTLKAANETRKYAKQDGIYKAPIPQPKKAAKVEKRSEPKAVRRLFTEDEMAEHTGLRFKEVWVLVDLSGEPFYVKDALNKSKKTLVEHTLDLEEALTYKSYEEAQMTANTLKIVGQGYHKILRFFYDTTNE